MPNPLDITLRAASATATSGTGSAVDIGLRTYSELKLAVSLISGSLTVIVESSPSNDTWVQVGHFKVVTAIGQQTLIIPDGFKYLRVTWTVTGACSFSVVGTAHQVYATPNDVSRVGLAQATLSTIPVADIATACLNASSEAEGYLAAAHAPPIERVDAATRQHIARMAVFELFRFRTKPSGDSAAMIEVGRSDALTWLNRIAAGTLRPIGLADIEPPTPEAPGTPTSLSSGGVVVSQPQRRW